MAGNFSLQIKSDNTDEFEKRLAQGCLEAFEEIGVIAEGYAKSACPVDTGRLRNSISFEADDRKVSVGTNVEYAPYIELGTSKHSPQPFIRPSIEDHINQFRDIIVQELTNSVN